MSDCICGDINSRHCPVHNEAAAVCPLCQTDPCKCFVNDNSDLCEVSGVIMRKVDRDLLSAEASNAEPARNVIADWVDKVRDDATMQLATEVDKLKAQRDRYEKQSETYALELLNAERERDRYRAALEEIMETQIGEFCNDIARKALKGDK